MISNYNSNEYYITDKDIEVAQQLAIWHYTNENTITGNQTFGQLLGNNGIVDIYAAIYADENKATLGGPIKYILDNSGNIHRRFYDIKFNNNVLLEINGDRVHANPEIYHDPNEIIKMQTYSFMARDKWNDDLAKQKLALQNNYIVIYLWENKIRKMKSQINSICSFINNHK